MNIGFVSTWFERGAAYVTKAYIDLLKENHDIFLYARGGEKYGKGDKEWDKNYVTWGYKLGGTRICLKDFKKWIIKNKLDIIFFNEQREIEPILFIKNEFPNIKIGSYIDYYKCDNISDFNLYDFLICNTKRHFSVFKNHKQAYYVPWGTDIDMFKPKRNYTSNNMITFFHSSGMSDRKGTDLLIRTFINYELYNKSKLIIHTQKNLNNLTTIDVRYLNNYNIEIICKTVGAPGLYYLGDVYVYPTKLEGLGLTIYEALSCGLPVITTNNSPMNEVVNDNVGKLIKVDKLISRSDGYYWPISICNEKDLADKMKYYIENKENLPNFQIRARDYAINNLNWYDRKQQVLEIFENTKLLKQDKCNLEKYKKETKRKKIKKLGRSLIDVSPDIINHLYYNNKKY